MNPVPLLKKNDFLFSKSFEILDLSFLGAAASQTLFIENGVFDPLIELKYLNLSYNFIMFLRDGVFKNNQDLVTRNM